MASIQLKSVLKTFGDRPVVKDISIDVKDGEFLVLLGPSGCGKSTLLRMLAGLETITGGEIHINDRRVDQLPPTDRDIAFVFQSYALYPHMTVRRNISFPLIMREHRWWFHLPIIGGMARRRIERSAEVAQLVEKTAKTLALTDWLDKFPRTLSGGQRQRVALGRAMVRQPQVFLMDEPLSNLDAKLRTSMRSEISKLHERVGGTFVYVTHDQVEAMTMGTRIALLKDGVVQQLGTPREIYESPTNVYVARFIGTPPMNLLHAEIRSDMVHIGNYVLPLPSHLRAVLPGPYEGPIVIGVRPNQFSIAADTAGMPGLVSLVEHVGAESVVAITLHGVKTAHDEDASTPHEVMVTFPGYTPLTNRQPVSLQVSLHEAVLFSAKTGENLDLTSSPKTVS
ncbi:MAG: ABC transporter ATP-binding protein [Polaromonas sp.]|uniref:ABC transporter ATP-binding protein n=1 Tax=Polaromonas sp. TaxID=1869339 RepID=UPI002487DCA7|nr:ABC transporter ATP-binding protein [Polaromonas sp.]MDI1270509.1 ABC transporter ATP-binding protein [Polaromonas sp.]